MATTNFHQLIKVQTQKYGDRAVIFDRAKITDNWRSISWNDLDNLVDNVSQALLKLGVEAQDRIAQFSQNKSENLIVDFASYRIRGVIVPIYPTSTDVQVEFITNDSASEIIFVGNQQQYDIAIDVAKRSKHLKKVIAFEKDIVLSDSIESYHFDSLIEMGKSLDKGAEIEKRINDSSEKDISCLLYTSGTTGNPKGVIITHEMVNEAMRIHQIRLPHLGDTDTSLAFLPLTHVFERLWCYFLLFIGATNYINHTPTEIQQALKMVKPTLMCAVPRFWEKVFIGVGEVLKSYSPLKLAFVTWAVAIGKKHNIDYLRVGKQPNMYLRMCYKLADRIVYSKLRTTLGLENAKTLPVAGAKLSDNITLFFRSIGVPIVYGYGLTETVATVSCFEEHDYEVGTVGSLMPDIQAKIGDDNEILLKGKTITPGYYKNPEANEKAFTPDGWFRTGDAGYIRGNKLILTERLKDLFKTSNGKYIAPQEIETRLGTDKYIEQVAIIGNERNYVTAIVAPAITPLIEYAKKENIEYSNTEELLQNPKIYRLIEQRIAEHQKGMANYELIKKFVLIKIPFTIETGELTNTLKIRRDVISQKYNKLIDEMYQ